MLLSPSCDKFEGEQTIPSYIRIDSFRVVDNPLIEMGQLNSNISDVWVYVDDQIIGTFELPAERIPVLVSGTHKLTVLPGIKYNGVSATRGPYPFYQSEINEAFEFFPDSTVSHIPVTSYYTNSFLAWLEDFEDGSISLEPTPNSDTSLSFYPHAPQHPTLGFQSGIGYVETTFPILEVSTITSEFPGLVLPTAEQPVFMEIDYNINIDITVGLYIRSVGVEIRQKSIAGFRPTGGAWKKAYVNLSPIVSDYPSADYFHVFIRADYNSGVESPQILLDNLKVVHKK
ncbi:MAG: hypothetical protein R2764_07495 [Bacteroidales bacterium]